MIGIDLFLKKSTYLVADNPDEQNSVSQVSDFRNV
jgi:hypothetical protein